jgi:hypothetical protein
MVLLAALGGCMSMEQGSGAGGGFGGGGFGHSHGDMAAGSGCFQCEGRAPEVPGVVGPYGQPVPMVAPYAAAPPGAEAARSMLNHSVPLELVQAGGLSAPGASSGVVRAGGIPPAGLLPGTITPAGGLMAPPGVPPAPGFAPPGGGGPMPPGPPPCATPYPPGAVAAVGGLLPGGGSVFPTHRTEVRFVRPSGMRISWYAPGGAGATFTTSQIEAPGRYNFAQGAIYRLKLSNIEGRPGLELYPTLEVYPSAGKTDAFLAHSAVPVEFTNEDLDQVAAGNYVVKVIYLPDPQFQDLATTGPDEIVSTRLEPGCDPCLEAQRRGCILVVIRVGNIDLEAPNTPAMDAPSPYKGMPHVGAGMPFPGLAGRGPAVPGRTPAGPAMGMMPNPAGNPGVPPWMMGPGAPGMGPRMPMQMVPPAGRGVPGVPTGMPAGPGMMPPPAPPGGPSTQGPGSASVQQASYTAGSTPAQWSGQPAK